MLKRAAEANRQREEAARAAVESARPLMDELEKDYVALREKTTSSQRRRLVEAENNLKASEDGLGRNYPHETLRVLRRMRAKAAIPLLLENVLRHAAGYSQFAGDAQTTLTLLTGKRFPDRWESSRGNAVELVKKVRELTDEWWRPGKDTITTDLEKMGSDEVDAVAMLLLDRFCAPQVRDALAGGASATHSCFVEAIGHDSETHRRVREAIGREDVSASMLPALLDFAEDGDKSLFGVVNMVAVLREQGLAPKLEDVVQDGARSVRTRLAAHLAVHTAGEKLKVAALVPLLKTAEHANDRLLLLLALGRSEAKSVVPAVVEQASDANTDIRQAAIFALGDLRAKAELKKLTKDRPDWSTSEPILCHMLATFVNDREATDLVAEGLKAAIEGPCEDAYLIMQILFDFERVVGKDAAWSKRQGGQNADYYRAAAKEALAWWKAPKAKPGADDDRK
ncbi:HEAT repeat domain-containing protein [bacterium]|nr:HEAT repeat domain-containing protein [bacterium]